MKAKTPIEIANEEREKTQKKAEFLFKADIVMQFIFKIIMPTLIFLLDFTMFLITILNPDILKVVGASIFFILSIAFIIAIKTTGAVK